MHNKKSFFVFFMGAIGFAGAFADAGFNREFLSWAIDPVQAIIVSTIFAILITLIWQKVADDIAQRMQGLRGWLSTPTYIPLIIIGVLYLLFSGGLSTAVIERSRAVQEYDMVESVVIDSTIYFAYKADLKKYEQLDSMKAAQGSTVRYITRKNEIIDKMEQWESEARERIKARRDQQRNALNADINGNEFWARLKKWTGVFIALIPVVTSLITLQYKSSNLYNVRYDLHDMIRRKANDDMYMSYDELAEKTGMKRSTLHRRVSKIRREKIMSDIKKQAHEIIKFK